MSFQPLPTPFLAALETAAAGHRGVVEIGCGDGDFLRLLRPRCPGIIGVDRVRPSETTTAVVGDALAPPLRPGCCDLVIAANLVRHLVPRQRRCGFLATWAGLLGPGGSLFVFEDAPRRSGGPEGNYGRLQDLLARLAPDQRGGLLDRAALLQRLPALGLTATASGDGRNTWPLDAAVVLEFLERGRPRVGGEVAQLMARIARQGIACGPYWWVRIERREDGGS